jgi:hypothetical protein
MPLHTIITAAKTVSRASPALSFGLVSMTETISAVSMTVTASASTRVPNGSPRRCATTSAWYTAAKTVPNKLPVVNAANNGPIPRRVNPKPKKIQANKGHVHAHQGVRTIVIPGSRNEALRGIVTTRRRTKHFYGKPIVNS